MDAHVNCSDDGEWTAYLDRNPALAFYSESRPAGFHRLPDVAAPDDEGSCEVIVSGVDGSGKCAVVSLLNSALFETPERAFRGPPFVESVYWPRSLDDVLDEAPAKGVPSELQRTTVSETGGHRTTTADGRARVYRYSEYSPLEPPIADEFPEERLRGLAASLSEDFKIVVYLRSYPAESYDRMSDCLKMVYPRAAHADRHWALERAWASDVPRPHPVFVIDADDHLGADGAVDAPAIARKIFDAVKSFRV